MSTASLTDTSTGPGGSEAIVNISCYLFVPLNQLQDRRAAILERATELQLRGTVLLSAEGINLFVAGSRESIDQFVAFLKSDPLLADLQPKESISDYQPFNRMLVKVKHEIIAFGVDSVNPAKRTSPKLPARELAQWLSEGRRVHLLDVRNDYEYDLGTFDNAIRMDLDHFRNFPDAVARLPEELKDEPVVMFCTGGIRCEKAGPYMEQAGFRQVYQLDGGILKYFEEVGGQHYHGECFVFDQRVGVDPGLRETATTQCYVCQAVVTSEQQQLPEYVPGQSCPACYQSGEQRLATLLESRHQQIEQLTRPLPGSQPCLNRRPLNVPQRYAGYGLLDFLSAWHPQVSRDEWRQRIEDSRIVPGARVRRRRAKAVTETLPLSPDRIVREGERFDHLIPGHVEPDVSGAVRWIYEDEHLIVLNKPAPLPLHASGRFERNTLRHFINQIYYPERPHIVHRLDANTSGVLVLCRRKSVARVVQRQFEERRVEKLYLARVHGHPPTDQFECDLALSAQAEDGGMRRIVDSADGDDAFTRFAVIRRNPDGTSLLQAFPQTGRTNQIRAHLWALGFPICGDPAYLRDQQTGSNWTLLPSDPPMCLHASRITLQNQAGETRTFVAPDPEWTQGGHPQLNQERGLD